MAFTCDFGKGRKLPCKDQKGGIKNLYIANYDNYVFTVANEIVTALGTLAEVFKWELKGANTFTQTPTVSRENGTAFVSQVVAATFPSLDPDTQNELKLMMYGRPIIFVEDYNGNITVGGIENGMEMTGGSIVTGGASGDLTGFTVELTGDEKTAAPFLNSAMKTALFALVSTSVVGTV
jgi:hypothetical protein